MLDAHFVEIVNAVDGEEKQNSVLKLRISAQILREIYLEYQFRSIVKNANLNLADLIDKERKWVIFPRKSKRNKYMCLK